MTLSAFLVLALAIIAGNVAAMQYVNRRKDQAVMWCFIVAYWLVLTLKNLCDLFGW